MNNFTYLKDKDFSQGRKYIGASDIPTLALLNIKYGQTPLSLWEVMTGRKEAWKGNSRTFAGHELEPLILKWGLSEIIDKDIADKWYKVRVIGKKSFGDYHSWTEAICPQFKHLVAHADLIDVCDPYIMEAKSVGFFGGMRKDDDNYGYDLSDNNIDCIPLSVALQCYTQCLCYDIDTFYVSVMIDTGIKKTYGPFKADRKKQEYILALAEKFYWHVENDTPPKPETWEDVQKLNPVLDKESKTVVIGETEQTVIEMKDRAKNLRKKQKEIDKELDDIKNAIGLIIGENAYLENSEGNSLASAYNVTRESIKLTELKKEKIRIYNTLKKNGFITENSYRQLRY